MVYEHLRDTTLSRLVSTVISDAAQLFQAEVRLAKAEITSNVNEKLQSIVSFAIAGVFGFVTLILIAETFVFLLMAWGFESYWASAIVAVGFGVLTGAAIGFGKSKARQELTPQRTVHQVNKDIRLAKEQLQ